MKKKKSKKKLWIWLTVLALLVVGGAGTAMKLKGRGDELLEVETEPVELQTIVQTVNATGRIQPKTQINISADVSAKIKRLEVKEGDWVEKGQFLLELDRERYVAIVESAEANLRATQANAQLAQENLNKAEKDYVRMKQLFDENLESQASLDAAYASYQGEKARVQASLDQVEQVRGALKQTQDDLSKTTIYAPITGTVSKLNKETGEIALGSQFQEDVIMIISNLAGMEALVDVDENDIVSIDIGDEAEIEVDALPDMVFKGQVTEIANSAKMSGSGTTDQKTEFEVKITILDPSADLRPGMTATSDIITETKHNVLGVPIQSVAVRTATQLAEAAGSEEGADASTDFQPDRDGFVEIVFVIEDGLAKARQVTTGVQSDSHIEIVDGITENDEVVIGNYRAISKDLQHDLPVEASRKSEEG